VLRDRPEELVEWFDREPYSREVHDDWVEKFYNGYRPGDDVERAGQFFTLRYTQWGAKYETPSGFGTSKSRANAQSFDNKIDILDRFAERFADVTIEHLDWADVLEKYDAAKTVFYCDPSYGASNEGYCLRRLTMTPTPLF